MALQREENRVLVLAPTRADAEVTLRVLSDAGVYGEICPSGSELAREILRGAGAVILTDDVARGSSLQELRFLMDRQPSWSELPILMLARSDSPSLEIFRGMAGVVLLERPVQMRSMVSAVQAALRARLRQYQLRDQLERTRAANVELKNAAQAKDDFLATLSHELRNPLSALRSAVELLQRPGLSTTVENKAKDIVSRQVILMGHLLDDLLDVARITRGRLNIQMISTPVSEIVRSAVENVQPLIERKGHEFSVSLPDRHVHIHADPVRLSQVLSNLLANAAKYTDPQGKISLVVDATAEHLIFRVRDSGIGIPLEHQTEIFARFTQLRSALTSSEGGLGIGLALAKGLVELHRGKISVVSGGVGLGSEFIVELPIAQLSLPSTSNAATESELPTPADKCDVIVADDNPDAVESLGLLLEREGHQVRIARDGVQVLELLETRIPDVMVLDIGMPFLNGYEVAERVRAQGLDVTLIALTGWGQPSDLRRSQTAGFDHHFTKPLEYSELSTLLARRCGASGGVSRVANQ